MLTKSILPTDVHVARSSGERFSRRSRRKISTAVRTHASADSPSKPGALFSGHQCENAGNELTGMHTHRDESYLRRNIGAGDERVLAGLDGLSE